MHVLVIDTIVRVNPGQQMTDEKRRMSTVRRSGWMPFALVAAIIVSLCSSSLLLSVSSAACSASSSNPSLLIGDEVLEGPSSPSSFPSWIAAMQSFRSSVLAELNYSGAAYDIQELQWVQLNNSMQTLAMIHDQFLYDAEEGVYTPLVFLADLRARYGGIQSVLLWHSYPNIGVDNRNQFEMLASLPGYPEEVQEMIATLHEQGVKVLLPYNPWDVGTSRPPLSDALMMNQVMDELQADGFNGDTMQGIGQEFWNGQQKGSRKLLQPEVGLNDNCSDIETNVATSVEQQQFKQSANSFSFSRFQCFFLLLTC